MKHGTRNTYDYHKCRCEECIAAVRAYRKRYRSTPEGKQKTSERQRRYRSTDAGRQKQREAYAKGYRAIRDEIRAIKLAAQCMDCTEVFEDPTKLEFDHRDPDSKLFDVMNGIYRQSRAAVYAEIEKCDVVCKPCHVERTRARGQYVENGGKRKVTHAS